MDRRRWAEQHAGGVKGTGAASTRAAHRRGHSLSRRRVRRSACSQAPKAQPRHRDHGGRVVLAQRHGAGASRPRVRAPEAQLRRLLLRRDARGGRRAYRRGCQERGGRLRAGRWAVRHDARCAASPRSGDGGWGVGQPACEEGRLLARQHKPHRALAPQARASHAPPRALAPQTRVGHASRPVRRRLWPDRSARAQPHPAAAPRRRVGGSVGAGVHRRLGAGAYHGRAAQERGAAAGAAQARLGSLAQRLASARARVAAPFDSTGGTREVPASTSVGRERAEAGGYSTSKIQ